MPTVRIASLSLSVGLLLVAVSACSQQQPPRPVAAASAPAVAPAEPQPVSPAALAAPDPVGVPALRPDPAACAASVAQAQDSGAHPERLSLEIAPAAYVRPADDAAMQRYLNTIEPGRVYQTADPASGAPQLEAVGGGATTVIPRLGSTSLAVRTVPGAPCTFLALQGGGFDDSGLSCATVLATADGIARVTYRADAGTVDDAAILVGSPDAVGTLTLMVHVHHPDSFMPAPAGVAP